MILICKHKAFYKGRSIRPGEACDIPDDEIQSDRVKASFETPATAEAKKNAEAKLVQQEAARELSAAELKRRLDELGIPYKGNASKDALKQMLAAHLSAQDDAGKAQV